ncbi:hypothetical protein COCMIDRAFT_21627 [Bipolaris oryzae ATCC 44560]|uniref:Uncharacterized protein n=1 Tax=Bipolaris oryzae ATCC 44560 TaxID=930090 RepID=W6ZGF4_COCMI|nr:uncharacterized protein COCMIDRAFT_21627 [Bipolaris oryzae ATCC 44560]EUC50912.1 hypothetical protein COCMIDRAFT_21627 [Bipolaris oryzae ATCC 44560]
MRQPKKSNGAQRTNQAISDNAQIRPSAITNYAMEREVKCFNSTLALRIQMFARLHMVTQSRRTIQSAASLPASPLSRLVTKNPPMRRTDYGAEDRSPSSSTQRADEQNF